MKFGEAAKGQRKIYVTADNGEEKEYSVQRGVHVSVQECERLIRLGWTADDDVFLEAIQLSQELEEAAARVQQEVTAAFEEAERELELMRQEGEAEEMAAE